MTRRDDVRFLAIGRVDASRLDDFATLMDEVIAMIAKHEPHTLHYGWATTDGAPEGSVNVEVHEHYTDADAAALHLDHFSEYPKNGDAFGERFLALFQNGFTRIYGTPNDALKQHVAGWGHFVEQKASYRR